MSGEIHEKTFRGKTFKFMKGKTDPQSSLFTFEDEQVVRDRFWNIEPGEVVFDIGAAFGSYTLPAAALGAKMVYSFCPQAEFDDLVNNINLNKFKNVTPLKIGFYSKKGWLDALKQGFSTGRIPDNPHVFQVTTLDKVVFEQIKPERIDYLKLDVEGAEAQVLWGGFETMKHFKPRRVLVENHLFKKASLADEVYDFMSGLDVGYVELERVPYSSISHSYYELKSLQ